MQVKKHKKPSQKQKQQPGIESEMVPHPEFEDHRFFSQNLIAKGIRVNGVAPGPIWMPLIPASFSANEVKEFGRPMKRAGEPKEIAPCYVFLASDDASYMSGQVLHPNGGVIVNG